jgi:protein phosphatase
MNSIKFSIAAWSDAAGRPSNEDSFLIGKDLEREQWSFKTNETVTLGKYGALIVVCDGMGGANAGEIASALAVDAVKEAFSPGRLNDKVIACRDYIQSHIRDAILAADRRIKKEASSDPAKSGMGSTIVLAWLLGGEVHVGWCGDSRAYRFNPVSGLEQLSHDHSYVQELVDSGRLSPELAHQHPNSNIITRSLGDSGIDAQPETDSFTIFRDDVLLLCSDGLNGVLADHEIEDIIRRRSSNMHDLRDELLAVSQKAGWTDNVTIALCRISSGGAKPRSRQLISETVKQIDSRLIRRFSQGNNLRRRNRYILLIILLLVAALTSGLYFFFNEKQPAENGDTGKCCTDTTTAVQDNPVDSTKNTGACEHPDSINVLID